MHSAGNLWKRKKIFKISLGVDMFVPGRYHQMKNYPCPRIGLPSWGWLLTFIDARLSHLNHLDLPVPWPWSIASPPRRMQSCAPRCGKAGRLLSYWIVSYRGLLGRIPCCSQRPYKLRQVPTYQTCFIGSLGIGLNIRTCFKFFFIRSTPLFPNPLDEAHL